MKRYRIFVVLAIFLLSSSLMCAKGKKDLWKSNAAAWWNNTSKSSGYCDICNVTISKGEGYLLSSDEVASSPKYKDYVFKQQSSIMKALGMGDQEIMDSVSRLLSQAKESPTPWISCNKCIDMFLP